MAIQKEWYIHGGDFIPTVLFPVESGPILPESYVRVDRGFVANGIQGEWTFDARSVQEIAIAVEHRSKGQLEIVFSNIRKTRGRSRKRTWFLDFEMGGKSDHLKSEPPSVPCRSSAVPATHPAPHRDSAHDSSWKHHVLLMTMRG